MRNEGDALYEVPQKSIDESRYFAQRGAVVVVAAAATAEAVEAGENFFVGLFEGGYGNVLNPIYVGVVFWQPAKEIANTSAKTGAKRIIKFGSRQL